LQKLGFREVAVVSKRRQEFLAQWEHVETTLSIDDVDDVGRFIEIEQVASPTTLDRARESLQRLAVQLGLGPGERRSYLELLLAGHKQ
jgi:predicted adenylyl cyclase CyaB